MELNVKLEPNAIFKSNNDNDVGYDVCAWQFGRFDKLQGKRIFVPIDTDQIRLGMLERIVVNTGVSAEWNSANDWGDSDLVVDTQIRGRSGLNSDGLLCQFGTVDEGYRNNLYVTLINLSKEPIDIHQYDKIAQVAIGVAIKPTIKIVNKLDTQTDRGLSGHGSSGA